MFSNVSQKSKGINCKTLNFNLKTELTVFSSLQCEKKHHKCAFRKTVNGHFSN